MGERNTDPGDIDDENPKADDIRIEYHPKSGRETEAFAFEDFVRGAPDSALPVGPDPWLPFRTREDFEFTELVLEAKMSKAEVNSLISLFNRCKGENSRFTLSSYDDMHQILATASERLPKACLQTFHCVLYPLILCYLSLKSVPSLRSTRINYINLMSGYVQYGHG